MTASLAVLLGGCSSTPVDATAGWSPSKIYTEAKDEVAAGEQCRRREARDFVDGGWNVKALLKTLVLSSTYRQSSATTPELVARDPENRLLAHGPRVRLPAELIRDQALAVSGLLSPHLGGPSVYPYQPEKLTRASSSMRLIRAPNGA